MAERVDIRAYRRDDHAAVVSLIRDILAEFGSTFAPTSAGQGSVRCYAHAEAFARAAGYQAIWLDSSRRFGKARRLYERNGFVLLEELDNDWEDNVYEKRLG
jgi:GNAT superfamily N-acetyltransferase